MRNVLVALLSLSVVATFAGCEYPTVQDGVDGPALGTFNTSGCKLDNASQRSLMDGNMIEAVVFETSVTIIHHDAQYQCNAEIGWELEVNGTTLILREVDKSTVVTRCMCPMDLSTTIENLAAGGKYTIQVWDEFQTRMFGEVTVDLGDCNEQCVTDEDCWAYPDLPRLDARPVGCIEGCAITPANLRSRMHQRLRLSGRLPVRVLQQRGRIGRDQSRRHDGPAHDGVRVQEQRRLPGRHGLRDDRLRVPARGRL